jgi:hypothetical protein
MKILDKNCFLVKIGSEKNYNINLNSSEGIFNAGGDHFTSSKN